MGSVEKELIATRLKPLGVRVTNFDVRNEHERNKVRDLLWENGVVILPAGAAREGAIPVHCDESLALLGNMFGEPEGYHPVNQMKDNTDVQILETRGDSGIPADSFLFHSDMSWRVNPSRASVLCAIKVPATGGDTCFQSSHEMYQRLSPETKQELHQLNFSHSLNFGYSRVNRPGDVKNDVKSIHPAVVRHPVTGLPLLYINENFTVGAVGMSKEEADVLMDRVFKEALCDDNVLTHNWTQFDVVIWDNIGTQHKAKADYEELRVMHRVVAGDPDFRFERYTGQSENPDVALRNVEFLLSAKENSAAYAKLAKQYEQDIDNCGYQAPRVGTDLLAEHIKASRGSSNPLILDVCAGTGRNALYLRQDHNLTSIEAFDLCPEMLMEAQRRNLYRKYHIGNANKAFPFVQSQYDAVLCIGGLAQNQVEPRAIEEMIRVTKPGGLVVVSFQERNTAYSQMVERLIDEQLARLVEKHVFHGIAMLEDVTHAAYILKPVIRSIA